jgi:hypothetical protein
MVMPVLSARSALTLSDCRALLVAPPAGGHEDGVEGEVVERADHAEVGVGDAVAVGACAPVGGEGDRGLDLGVGDGDAAAAVAGRRTYSVA